MPLPAPVIKAVSGMIRLWQSPVDRPVVEKPSGRAVFIKRGEPDAHDSALLDGARPVMPVRAERPSPNEKHLREQVTARGVEHSLGDSPQAGHLVRLDGIQVCRLFRLRMRLSVRDRQGTQAYLSGAIPAVAASVRLMPERPCQRGMQASRNDLQPLRVTRPRPASSNPD